MKNLIFLTVLICGFLAKGQSLQDYQVMAVQNHPGLMATYKEFEAAMEKIPQVSSLPDPSFSFGYFISPVETRVGPQRARLSLTQMFPWFGTLKAQKEVAALEAEARYQAFIDAKNRVYYQVAEAYYPLYELERLHNIELQNIEILESYKAIATSKFENGKGSLVDALRVDILLNDAKTNLSILKQSEDPFIARLKEVIAVDSLIEFSLPDTLSVPDAYLVSPDSLARHPQLKELEIRERAYEQKSVAAQKQGLPKIGAGLDYVIVGEREDMALADNGKDVLMPMVTLSLPIFRGKYRASIKEAELMEEATLLRKQSLTNSLQTQFASSKFQLQKQADLVHLFSRQIVDTERNLKLLFSSYQNGETDFEEILNTRQNLLNYQKQKASAEAQYFIEQAKLNYLTSTTSDQ